VKTAITVANRMSSIQPSYIREILSAATAPGIISLAGGLPASELFPISLFDQALASLSLVPEVYQYGETQGYPPLLDYLNDRYEVANGLETMVCNGSQQAIDLIARAFLNPNDSVVMEAPSYLGAIQVFGLAQAKIKTIPQLADGPDLIALETLFGTGRIKLFYAVPDFHNPTGISWSLQHRRRVAALCCRYDVLLIEDAPYRSLRFKGTDLPLVSSFCPERAFLLRSYSKISAPGMRIGTVTAPTVWLNPMITIKQCSDLHTNLPMQAALLFVLKHADFPKHKENIRKQYAARHQKLSAALSDKLTPDCSYNTVNGGMFIWLELPPCDAHEVAMQALREGVAVVPGDVFFLKDHSVAPALRLNFSHTPEDQFIDAIGRLKIALEKVSERAC